MNNTIVALGTGLVLAIGLAWQANGFGAPVQVRLPEEKVELRRVDMCGYELAAQKCGICHSADYIAYQPPALTISQWTAEVSKMRHTYGAPLDDDDVTQIGAYLAVAYGNAKIDDPAVADTRSLKAVASAPVSADATTRLTRNGCLGCHAIDQKIVGPSYKDVAARYRTDPSRRASSRPAFAMAVPGSGEPPPCRPFHRWTTTTSGA